MFPELSLRLLLRACLADIKSCWIVYRQRLMDWWQDTWTLWDPIYQGSCACISVYVLVVVGQSREMRFSNEQRNLLLFSVHRCFFKQSWRYTGFVDNPECFTLQHVPDVRSSRHRQHNESLINWLPNTFIGNEHIVLQDEPNPSGIFSG